MYFWLYKSVPASTVCPTLLWDTVVVASVLTILVVGAIWIGLVQALTVGAGAKTGTLGLVKTWLSLDWVLLSVDVLFWSLALARSKNENIE